MRIDFRRSQVGLGMEKFWKIISFNLFYLYSPFSKVVPHCLHSYKCLPRSFGVRKLPPQLHAVYSICIKNFLNLYRATYSFTFEINYEGEGAALRYLIENIFRRKFYCCILKEYLPFPETTRHIIFDEYHIEWNFRNLSCNIVGRGSEFLFIGDSDLSDVSSSTKNLAYVSVFPAFRAIEY